MDKREQKRHHKQIKVAFGEKACEHIGLTADVSSKGMLVRANRIYPPHTPLVIDFSLWGQQKTQCKGIVRWAKRVPPRMIHLVKNGMGIFLTDIPLDYQSFIDELEHPSHHKRAVG